ncbi:MAG TPA: TerC/Alx family metal homeostasis membrane protein [Actinophytocola sp.]|uniref:TerC/Alx family metal homeostasis membrane protein n=1 Tax=Actinophytocola sp. TaxID=1872138 RepID=UPI002DDD8665|nr:TerC/Alx family metal homeostasis membrane protein [Actinophytocola sp.]HEV2781067.1 TerC/Alx family metal homeostasis membrane protein [Actinophytocola sp.]
MMNLPGWVWLVTVAGLSVVIMLDFYIVARNPRQPSMRECLGWVSCYVLMAAVFGLGVLAFAGPRYGGEFFAGWITEYSLSVDNLFVFVLIMSSFAVPRAKQQTVLSIGIILALALRGVFIAVGAEAVARFDWLFYVFGAFLLYTAWKLLRHKDPEDEEFRENLVVRLVRRRGGRWITPMLVVMVAIGTTDLLFALDSIPAIFGLTREPYLVFTANAFALMGLRQLFFLIGGLLDRLTYLNTGLAVVLAFIGVKLIVETLHQDGVSRAPEIPILISLAVIVGTLVLTGVTSLIAARHRKPSEEPVLSKGA